MAWERLCYLPAVLTCRSLESSPGQHHTRGYGHQLCPPFPGYRVLGLCVCGGGIHALQRTVPDARRAAGTHSAPGKEGAEGGGRVGRGCRDPVPGRLDAPRTAQQGRSPRPGRGGAADAVTMPLVIPVGPPPPSPLTRPPGAPIHWPWPSRGPDTVRSASPRRNAQVPRPRGTETLAGARARRGGERSPGTEGGVQKAGASSAHAAPTLTAPAPVSSCPSARHRKPRPTGRGAPPSCPPLPASSANAPARLRTGPLPGRPRKPRPRGLTDVSPAQSKQAGLLRAPLGSAPARSFLAVGPGGPRDA